MKKSRATKPVGRPSKYQPAYAEEVITYCADGYSLTAFAGSIGVCRETISEWCREHEEFSVAVNRAKAKRAAWWEEQARKVAQNGGPGGQATMVIFGLKNHAPDDFKDVTRQEHTGKDGGPMEHRIDAPIKETREEWLARQMGAAAGAATGRAPGDVVR